MKYHGGQIFMIAAEAFYNLRKLWQIINIWSPLYSVVDIAFQKNPDARRFSKP